MPFENRRPFLKSQCDANFIGDPEQNFHRGRQNGDLLRFAPGAYFIISGQPDLKIHHEFESGVDKRSLADKFIPVPEGIDMLGGGPDDRKDGFRLSKYL